MYEELEAEARRERERGKGRQQERARRERKRGREEERARYQPEAEERSQRQEKKREQRQEQREEPQAAPRERWFEVLGVAPNVSLSEIKVAWRTLVMQLHSDKLNGMHPDLIRFADERVKAANAAYAEAKRTFA